MNNNANLPEGKQNEYYPFFLSSPLRLLQLKTEAASLATLLEIARIR